MAEKKEEVLQREVIGKGIREKKKMKSRRRERKKEDEGKMKVRGEKGGKDG